MPVLSLLVTAGCGRNGIEKITYGNPDTVAYIKQDGWSSKSFLDYGKKDSVDEIHTEFLFYDWQTPLKIIDTTDPYAPPVDEFNVPRYSGKGSKMQAEFDSVKSEYENRVRSRNANFQ
jgi:hypothetical protein